MTSVLIKDPPAPGSDPWRKMISASKIPAILGISPYQTRGELWMEMTGWAEPDALDDTSRDLMMTGNCMEPGLGEFWARKNPGWQLNTIHHGSREVAYTRDDLPFPNLATLDARPRRGRRYMRLEFKTSASRTKWGQVGEELPADVAAQVQWQAGVSGIEDGQVVALVGSDMPLIPRIYEAPADHEVFKGLVDVAQEFYESLGESEPEPVPQDLLDALTQSRVQLDDDTIELAEDDPDLMELWAMDTKLAELKNRRDMLADTILTQHDHKTLTVAGRKITRLSRGRFSTSRVPSEAKHLLKDPEVLTPKLDTKKFQTKYPEVYTAATGDDTITISTHKEGN